MSSAKSGNLGKETSAARRRAGATGATGRAQPSALAARSRTSERAKAIARLEDLWSIAYPRATDGSEHARTQCLLIYELAVRIAGFKAAAPMARAISRLSLSLVVIPSDAVAEVTP